MSACCEHDAPAPFDGIDAGYRRVLLTVIGLNAAMFAVEVGAGVAAHSMALLADALDFAADSATYALTLTVLGRPVRVRATAALVKAASLAAMATFVLGASLWRVFVAGVPAALPMGAVGALALGVNVAAAVLLFRYRAGDANVRSVWLCSRNDAIGNLAVIAAAGAVALTATPWPDLVVAAAMAGLFLASSARIAGQAARERRLPA